jgi:hypothetical protein
MASRADTARAVADRIRLMAGTARKRELQDAYLDLALQWDQAADEADLLDEAAERDSSRPA